MKLMMKQYFHFKLNRFRKRRNYVYNFGIRYIL